MISKIISLLPLLLVLTACGQDKHLDLGEFASYVADFEQVSVQVGKPTTVDDLLVRFGPTESPNEAGVCEIAGEETPVITINQDAWQQMGDMQKKALMFHELGHCVRRRGHRNDVDSGIPSSIMYPYTLSGTVYQNHQDYYNHELFEDRDMF